MLGLVQGLQNIMENPSIFPHLPFLGFHQCLHLGPQDGFPQVQVSHDDVKGALSLCITFP